MVPEVASVAAFKVAVAAANPFASVVRLKFAVPSVTVVVELVELLLPQLVPNARATTIAIPSQIVPRRLIVAKSSANRHTSTAQTSSTIREFGIGQSGRIGVKLALVTVAVNVTVPEGAVPELPTAGFVDVSVSTTTVSENAVFAITEAGLDVTAEVVNALVTLMVGELALLPEKLVSPA
jgi:hypothetical protein